MAIFELSSERLTELPTTSFGAEGVAERNDLQRILRDNIGVVAKDVLIIAEEFSGWQDSSRRIDLLGLDKAANLVVFELKRTSDGGHMELQALRYAAMVSTMTFPDVVETYAAYLSSRRRDFDAQAEILEFLGWTEPDEDAFAQDVSIVLVSADFSKEITTTVLWLNERDLNIRCVRLRPYKHNGTIFLDVQQVIPIPEAAEYMVRLKEKGRQERSSGAVPSNEAALMHDLEAKAGADVVPVARRIIEWANEHADRVRVTRYKDVHFCVAGMRVDSHDVGFVVVRSDGHVVILFDSLKKYGPLADEQQRHHFWQKLNQIDGVAIPEDCIGRRNMFPLSVLCDEQARSLFLESLDWLVNLFHDARDASTGPED